MSVHGAMTPAPAEPRYRVRVEVTKNTKSYNAETTAEVEWGGEMAIGEELLARLLRSAGEAARNEIEHRKRIDYSEGAS